MSVQSPSAKFCQEAMGDEPEQNDSLSKSVMLNKYSSINRELSPLRQT